MSFVIFGSRSWPYPAGTNIERGKANVAAECQSCRKTASGTLQHPITRGSADWANRVLGLVKDQSAVPNEDWALLEFWPKPQPARVPEYLPPSVEKAFVQGEKNLAMEGCEEPAATMFRRALDVGLKAQFPTLRGDLFKKIEKLAEQHTIPQSLADWAHEVRAIGNDGAHDLDGCSHEDASAARDFVDAVLRYLFSLPGMIAARRPAEPETAHDLQT